jgi:uncharacterized integral membrane protein
MVIPTARRRAQIMPLRTLLLGVMLLLVVLFAALNWSAFTTPMSLSLLFATVEAPLGLIMLGVIALLTVLFLVYLLYIQSTVLLDARRASRELQTQRHLADQAEASRFTELRTLLEERMQQLESVVREEQSRTGSRLGELETSLRSSVEDGANTVAANIGEFRDRMERRLGPSQGDRPG